MQGVSQEQMDEGLKYLLNNKYIPNTIESINNYKNMKEKIIVVLNNNATDNFNKISAAYIKDYAAGDFDFGPNLNLCVAEILGYPEDEDCTREVVDRMLIEDNICLDWFANISKITRVYK